MLNRDAWIQRFGNVSALQLEDYGPVQSRRVFYASGIEVEYGITTRDWLNTTPIDEGTQKVLNDGYCLLDDKVGLFSTFFANQRLMPPPSADGLASQVTAEFPALQFSDVQIVTSGVDHAVLILDSTWVFRFPRRVEYRASFIRELDLLKQLQMRCPVTVPHYEYISRAKDFGGYRIIRRSYHCAQPPDLPKAGPEPMEGCGI